MRHGFRSRVTATLLAALFLGGAGGASDLDAFLFHHVGAGALFAPHVEAAGNPGCHAEHCVLALRLASGCTEHPLPVAIRYEALPLVAAAAVPAAAPVCFFPGFHRHSRAPPASLV
jgi:hypothetical protein